MKVNENIKAFLVGVSKYKFNSEYDLPNCNNDVIFMQKALINGLNLDSKNIYTCIDSVEYQAFINNLECFLSKLNQNDIFIFYFSGHGGDTESGQIIYFSDGCCLLKSIIELIENSEVSVKLFIIDTCHAGSVMPEVREAIYEYKWMNEYISKGSAIYSACRREQTSTFLDDAPISVFTSFIVQAFTSKFIRRKGRLSLDHVKEYVDQAADIWNQRHDRIQTPVFYTNIVGGLEFEVDDYKEYISEKYYSNQDEYIICDVESLNTVNVKRYSVKVILKYPTDEAKIVKLSKKIIDEIEKVEIFESKQSERIWKGVKPNIVFLYFGRDELDITYSNYEYRSIWVDKNQDKEHWYASFKEVDDIGIIANISYEMLRKFTEDNMGDIEEVFIEYKKCINGMIECAEGVIEEYYLYSNKDESENKFRDNLQKTFKRISQLYIDFSDYKIAPIQLSKWNMLCDNLVASIHDFSVFYSDKFMEYRTEENRQRLMNIGIEKYHQDVRALTEEENEMKKEGIIK